MSEPVLDRDATRFDLTRRDFLRVGGVGGLGMTLPSLGIAHARGSSGRSVILLNLLGGPSQLETWDPKPDAPAEIRGPFGSIATRVPGVRISEHLPRLAQRLNKFTLIRSVHHDAAPIHETGLQLLQTGRLGRLGDESPHLGSVVSALRGERSGAPASVILPGPIGNTGVGISQGQSAGPLGEDHEPAVIDPDMMNLVARETSVPGEVRRALNLSREPGRVRDAYGSTSFGANCLRARRLVEAGVRVVTVNMFTTVFHKVSWDCHGNGPFSTLDDYRRELLPTLDRALSGLLDDLEKWGLLDETLVLAAGEFGRSPRLNVSGGRDHWPGVWSVAMAGGGTAGGTVIGASDPGGAEPIDRPVTPPEVLATVYRFLGIEVGELLNLPDGRSLALTSGAGPIQEVLA